EIVGDAAVNLDRLPAAMVSFCPDEGLLTSRCAGEIHAADVIVDALLGTGLRNDVRGVHREAIELMHASGKPIVAVDIPSGINGTTGQVQGMAVRACMTVTFAFSKLGHVLYPGAEYVGRL